MYHVKLVVIDQIELTTTITRITKMKRSNYKMKKVSMLPWRMYMTAAPENEKKRRRQQRHSKQEKKLLSG